MISAMEASKILLRRHPFYKVLKCFDLGNFFVFNVAPYSNSDGSTIHSGTVYPAVDKRNGKVFKYDIMSDVELYWAAKEVKITSIYNAPIGGNSKWD